MSYKVVQIAPRELKFNVAGEKLEAIDEALNAGYSVAFTQTIEADGSILVYLHKKPEPALQADVTGAFVGYKYGGVYAQFELNPDGSLKVMDKK